MSLPARRPARTHHGRRTVLAALGLAATVLAFVGPVTPSSAAGQGHVRLAHFSPDTPEVDVYLSSFADPAKPAVFRGVGYGVLSEYQRLPEGRYTIAMRLEGAAASTPPVLSTDVRVVTGKAYSVAGVGRNANLALQVIDDDLSTPPAGQGRIRVIQASSRAPVVTVNAGNDAVAQNASFPSASPYAPVEPGALDVAVKSGSNDVATAKLAVAAGDVYSLVVLDDTAAGGSAVKLLTRNDARSASAAPAGGVETGLGGTAGDPAGGLPGGALSAVSGLLLLLLGGAGAVALRYRSRSAR
jgi:hypothetical protein